MLSRQKGLKDKEIQKISRKGKSIRGDDFFVRAWFDKDQSENKFAISVSAKVSKKATQRNRIKRLFRAAIFDLEKEKFFRKGSYLFVIRNSSLAELKLNEIKLKIHEVFGG